MPGRRAVVRPHEADAERAADLHQRGVELLRQRNVPGAIECLKEAAGLAPSCAITQHDLGHAFRLCGQFGPALEHYRRALRLRADVAAIHASVAAMLQAHGMGADAETYAQQAAILPSGLASSAFQLGISLLRMRLAEEAEACFRFVLNSHPHDFDTLNNLGTAVWEQGRLEQAELHYREALAARPGDPNAMTNLGNALWQQGKAEEAENCYRSALERNPDSADTLMNLGIVLSGQGKQDRAIAYFERAIAMKPESAPLYDNLATALARQAKADEALLAYNHAIELQPGYAEAHRNRAMLRLSQGDYERGWPEYEWRWHCRGKSPAAFRQPVWRGEDIRGRTILLHAEQGHGDTLQFIRYAALVKQRGATVLVLCPPPVKGLLARMPVIDSVVTTDANLPDFDVHTPLMSLPAILGTTLATVPANVPYLHADPKRLAHWQARLGCTAGFKVGVAWQGNPRYGMDRLRSFRLAKLQPLAAMEGVRLISLQKGPGIEQLEQLNGQFRVEPLGGPGEDALGDFDETAAILKNLDLVISPDMVYAHLAGGLGIRTWVVLPFVAEWRWLSAGETSPWYPTARLFRQPAPGDWNSAFQQLAAKLRSELNPANNGEKLVTAAVPSSGEIK